jgi:hypothetical protein
MWQTICVYLPARTQVERARLAQHLHEALNNSTCDPEVVDIGLSFLPYLTSEEALLVLEERRDLVMHHLECLNMEVADECAADDVQMLMKDHIRTLLEAEQQWLGRTIERLRTAQAVRMIS